MTTGATLVIDEAAYSDSFPRLLRALEQQQITVLDLSTPFWHELVRHHAADRSTLPVSLRLVVIGGEAVDPGWLAHWCRLDTEHIRLLNTYGCTETTLITHAVDIYGPRASATTVQSCAARRVPIGRPLPHVVEHIGAESELYIGGPSIAYGYRGQPVETRERFATLDSGDRFFRTGDRVAVAADGKVEMIGRRDHEVKVRGIRVDPAEVGSHLIGCPGVAGASDVGTTLAGCTALVAYVVAEADADPAERDRRRRSRR